MIPVEKFLSVMPIDFNSKNDFLRANMVSMTLSASDVSKFIVETIIYTIFFMFTLPLRCCTFTNLYAALDIAAIGSNSHSDEAEDKE